MYNFFKQAEISTIFNKKTKKLNTLYFCKIFKF